LGLIDLTQAYSGFLSQKEIVIIMAQTLLRRSSDQIVSPLLGQSSWILFLRGTAALLFGLAALFWPGIALPVLVILFGVYAFLDGFFALVNAFRMAERHASWIPLLFEGVVGIAVGVIAFRTPGLAAVALVYVVAAWAVVTGCLEIVAAIELRKYMTGEWALGLTGLLSIVFGWLLLAQPLAGVATLVWLIGIYACVFGFLMIFVGVQMRRFSGSAMSRNILEDE
jgi:uncharacterized membrane protein HdeD (DUF308 family)